MKSLLLVAFAGLVLALNTAAPAAAGTPCWQALINDWFDGRINNTYKPECYTQAIKHLPRDVEMYSGAKDDIRRAMLAALRSGNGSPPTSGSSEPVARDPQKATPSSTPAPERHPKGVIAQGVEWLGPSNAASVPLPLLILAAVAFLLLAAAGGSIVNRWVQQRRLPPNPGA